MENKNELKKIVKEKYAQIAAKKNSESCCDNYSCCAEDVDYSNLQDDYTGEAGYMPDADLGLGCGIPTKHAGIKEGDVVVDLGSGAGNDAFVACAIVGAKGKVIGIDMTEEMIRKAETNKSKLGYDNVFFKLGDIENIPLEDNIADVVISNCVLNLVPDKRKAFAEIYRILKPGAHFCVSDIVSTGEMTEEFKKSAELYAGCVSGAIPEKEYLKIIEDTCFKKIEIKTSKKIELPDELLKKYLDEKESANFKKSSVGLRSITVTAYK
ncbi:Methyltransferase type 11 [Melioribacter roseus P3M-2]|uniref:Arsenite methyltransferase n=1 Tax=Melioribacter roseus (strain DSM 23840 / JCM 17771 / VKM B-2668 / P3M-2) TaxID=1191523 RepID=I6ZQD3_MELRP|nr:arsenite methyltransferase [Melioribacter roseus]AFN74284.1 Methyltransferase type 11 [Melioribacter roseus P3M-2]